MHGLDAGWDDSLFGRSKRGGQLGDHKQLRSGSATPTAGGSPQQLGQSGLNDEHKENELQVQGGGGDQSQALTQQGKGDSHLGSWLGHRSWGDWMNQHSMKLDLIENKDSYEVKADVAGFNKDQVKLSLDDNVLTISAEQSNEVNDEDKSKNYIHRERSYGSVKRSIRLPKDINSELAQAKFENGVLSVTLPRTEKKQSQIQIQ